MSTKKQKEKSSQKPTPNQIYQNINTQSTINSLKEILIPQIKETQAKQMIDIYEKKYQNNNKQNDINKTCSILDYSFVTGRENTKNDSNIKKKKSNQSLKSSNEELIEKQNFYERQIEKEAEKEEKINILKEKKEKEEQKHIQSKPIINKNSQIIINKSKTYQPIYKRINQIEYNQKQKIKQVKSMINKDLYKNHRNNSRPISKDEFDKWLQMNQTWDKLRQAKINYLKNDIESLKRKEEELEREEETFHPKINKNSSLILLQKNKNYLNQDVGERLYKTHFKYKNDIERKRNSSLPSFKPYINKHYEIKQEYYDYMNVEQKEIYDMLNVF